MKANFSITDIENKVAVEIKDALSWITYMKWFFPHHWRAITIGGGMGLGIGTIGTTLAMLSQGPNPAAIAVFGFSFALLGGGTGSGIAFATDECRGNKKESPSKKDTMNKVTVLNKIFSIWKRPQDSNPVESEVRQKITQSI